MSLKRPHPVDFIDFETLEVDQVAYQFAFTKWETECLDIPKKKIFRQRKSYKIKDPKTSQWYQDYVIDAEGTFADPGHR